MNTPEENTIETKKNNMKQISAFLIITSLISAGIFIWMFTSPEVSFEMVICMMFAPGVSALITSLLFKEKIRDYGWKLGKARFLGYSYVLPILAAFIAYGLAWLSGLADFTTERFGNLQFARWLGLQEPVSFGVSAFLRLTIGFLFTSIIVFGEEVGWSGFLTPKLLKIYSAPVTSLIVGGYWAIWHYPAIIAGEYGTGAPLWIALPGFTLVLIGASFLRTFLVHKSGSLWNGVVIHASHNMFLMGSFWTLTVHKGYANYFVSETGIGLGIIYILVALLFIRLQK